MRVHFVITIIRKGSNVLGRTEYIEFPQIFLPFDARSRNTFLYLTNKQCPTTTNQQIMKTSLLDGIQRHIQVCCQINV